MKKIGLSFFCTLLFISNVLAQITKADYERIDTVLNRTERVYSAAVRPNWVGDLNEFWYANHERSGDFYYIVNAETGKKQAAFNQDKLAVLLAKETGKPVKASKLSITDVEFKHKNEIEFKFNSSSWAYSVKQNKLIRLENKEQDTQKRVRWGNNKDTAKVLSPDKKHEAFIKDHNVHVRQVGTKDEIALSFDGIKDNYYGSRLIWSPDSKKLATVKVRDVKERQISLLESRPENQLQPILHLHDYFKPGDVLPLSLPVLFNVETKKQILLNTSLYENQFMLNLTAWRKDSRAFTFEFNQRGHQRFIVAEVNAANGIIHHTADEQSSTFIHYYGNYRYDLNDRQEMLWVSERDGWRHIYLLDGKNGQVKKQITKGEWPVRKVDYVDEANKVIYFTASGFVNGEDPYNLHYCKINMDGSGFTDMTPENGNHKVSFSKNRKYFVDVYSRPDLPPVSLLKKAADWSIISEIQRCDVSDLEAEGWQLPEVFYTKGRDGKTDIWGNIIRPSNFDAKKTYPVIEMIYAGPHDSHVDKDFRPSYHLISRLAELGFIVVSIDGMGTSNRSKAFHDVCWKNLKDAGFPDRILWIKAAAQKHQYMDISNVAIYGWSAGGQNAMGALLFHNDFYKTAVAFCGCHDNRMDKIWWNEQWMGYPIDESYSACSNVDNAALFKGKLLLVNGELDNNVDPASTLQVVSALIKANKNFEQLYLPGKGHALGGKFEIRKMHDFFVKHLLNQEPPEWE